MKAILEFDAPESCAECPLSYKNLYFDDGSVTHCIMYPDGYLNNQAVREEYSNTRAPFCELRIVDDKSEISREDAEEIVQNVFMIVWENRHKIEPQYSFSSYLFSIAKHQIYNRIRSKVAQRTFVDKYLQEVESVEVIQEYDDSIEKMKAKMEKIIDRFPDRQREIFKMSRTFNMTYKEIAEQLGISENTVDTSIRRSLDTLRNAFLRLIVFIFWLN